MYVGVENGEFSNVKEYNVDIALTTSVETFHGPFERDLMRIYNTTPSRLSDLTKTEKKIYNWLKLNKNFLETDSKYRGNPDTFTGLPYYFVRGHWYTLYRESPLFWNSKIVELPENILRTGFDLFYFAPGCNVQLEGTPLTYGNVYELGNPDKRMKQFKDYPLSAFIVKPLNNPLPAELPDKKSSSAWKSFKDTLIDIPFVISATPEAIIQDEGTVPDIPIPGTRLGKRNKSQKQGGELVDAVVMLSPDMAKRPANPLNTSIFNGDLELTEAVEDLEPCLMDIRKFCGSMRTQLSGLHQAVLLRITRTKNFQVIKSQVDRFTANAQARLAVQEMILKTQDKAKTATEQDTIDKLLKNLEGEAPADVSVTFKGAKGAVKGAAVGAAVSTGLAATINYAFAGLLAINPWTLGLGVAVLALASAGGASWEISEDSKGRHRNYKASLAAAYRKSKVTPSEINRMRGGGMKAYYEVMALRNYTNIIRKQISKLVVRRPGTGGAGVG